MPRLTLDARDRIDTDRNAAISDVEMEASLRPDFYAPGMREAHALAVTQVREATALLDRLNAEVAETNNRHSNWKLALTCGSIGAGVGTVAALLGSAAVLGVTGLVVFGAILGIIAAIFGIIALIGERGSSDHLDAAKNERERAQAAFDEAWTRLAGTLPQRAANPTTTVAPPAPVASVGVRLRSVA